MNNPVFVILMSIDNSHMSEFLRPYLNVIAVCRGYAIVHAVRVAFEVTHRPRILQNTSIIAHDTVV